ncbi:methyltransferase [Legionella shakespearei]|uniref:O-methyltransferase n=1 Tax=Legionella shakespearei DSM 23087 TaxID=1122169 RepID=A0A0W0Z1X7_9GAMM|nr:methyltransferase [Legionella shakespearei]KTD62819.1 O-methyltransferase [Legionella shakespearei DSM 23087]
MNNESPPPHMQLAIMSRGYVVSRAIHAIAHLGIADHMSDQPVSVKELAGLSATIPDLLDRLLTFLSDYGLFLKTEDGYALTPLSYPLRQDHPFSMKDVLGMFDESWWQAFAHLENVLKTGTPGFRLEHKTDFFDFLNAIPEKRARYNTGMAKLSAIDEPVIAQSFNFAKFRSLVNIGTGSTSLVEHITNQYPDLVIEQFNFHPELVQQAGDDLFSSLPVADAYLFRGRLHVFNDEQIKIILSNCRQQMSRGSTLLIAEQVIPDNSLPHTNKTMDIIMMVLVGGQQRTLNNWCELVESVGFALKSSTATKGLFTVMEFQLVL